MAIVSKTIFLLLVPMSIIFSTVSKEIMSLRRPTLNHNMWLVSRWTPVTPMDGVILISKGSNPGSLPRAVDDQWSQEVIGAMIRNWRQISPVYGLIARPPGLCPVDLLGEVSVAESSGCTAQDPSFRADNGCNKIPLIFSISTMNNNPIKAWFGLERFNIKYLWMLVLAFHNHPLSLVYILQIGF